MEVQLATPALLVAEQRVEQQRADVARAHDDRVGRRRGEDVVGVAVVAEPEVAEPGGLGLGARADHARDAHPRLRVDREQLGQLDRPAVGADDDQPLGEAVLAPVVGEPGPVERAPDRAGATTTRTHSSDDLLDVDVRPRQPVEHEHPDAEDRGRPA